MRAPGYVAAGWMMLAAAAGPSRVDGQEGSKDLRRLAFALELTGKDVSKWLSELGVNAGGPPSERLVALSTTGARLMNRLGERSSVSLGGELDRLLLQQETGIVLVHNHPTNVGLSGADIGQLMKRGVAAVAAIGHDGSVFMASAGRGMDPNLLEQHQVPFAAAEVKKRLRAEWRSGGVSVTVSDAHFSHLVTLALAKAGIIEYWFELSGANRSSYEKARVVFNRVVVGAAARLQKRK
jgi:hypothetical protein